MPGGLHRHCCCEPEPGPCGVCPRFGESITAVVSGIENCGCVKLPGAGILYGEVQLLSGSINGVHTLEWSPWVSGCCRWKSDPIARIRETYWNPPCSGPCDCLWPVVSEVDVYIDLRIRPDIFPPAIWLDVVPYIFKYSASELRCEGEYQNQFLICGSEEYGYGPFLVGGTITLSR